MAKWKCEICGNEFENFHAQGFDNKIYCPLCYFKKENQELKKQVEDISEELELVRCDLHNRTSERDSYEREINECLSQQKEFIKYLEDMLDDENDIFSVVRVKDILQKHKEIIEV